MNDRNQKLMLAYQHGQPLTKIQKEFKLSKTRVRQLIPRYTTLFYELQRAKNKYFNRYDGSKKDYKLAERLDSLKF